MTTVVAGSLVDARRVGAEWEFLTLPGNCHAGPVDLLASGTASLERWIGVVQVNEADFLYQGGQWLGYS